MTVAGNGDGRVGKLWLTVVMVLAAFIVGLFPFVISQGRYATKDDVEVIRTTQITVLERLSNLEAQMLLIEQNTDATAINTASIAEMQQDIAVLKSQLIPVGPTAP